MDNLQIELAKLRRDANLTESIQDVDKVLEQLEAAREAIVQGEFFIARAEQQESSRSLSTRPPLLIIRHICTDASQIQTQRPLLLQNYKIPSNMVSIKSTTISRRSTGGRAHTARHSTRYAEAVPLLTIY